MTCIGGCITNSVALIIAEVSPVFQFFSMFYRVQRSNIFSNFYLDSLVSRQPLPRF
jgi:hypothetical protein